MTNRFLILLSTCSLCAIGASASALDDQLRLPTRPSVNVPELPGSEPRRTSSRSTQASTSSAQPSRDTIREFNDLIRSLERTIDPTTTVRTLRADGERVDSDVAQYKQNADELMSGRFDTLIEQRSNSLSRLQRNYDSLSRRVDREVQFASNMVEGHGVAEAGYNYLLAIEAHLYGAEQLFPGNEAYRTARATVIAEMSKYGSRAGAAAAEDEAELAAARRVQMPAATTRDIRVERMFRSAYASAGLPYTILKVNIAGPWQPYREYGRVVGRQRDAHIAAKDPNSDRCNLYRFTMIVENGGSPRRGGHTTTRIACENVD